jgi:hypothetical protein
MILHNWKFYIFNHEIIIHLCQKIILLYKPLQKGIFQKNAKNAIFAKTVLIFLPFFAHFLNFS